MRNKLKTVTEEVERILVAYPQTRSSDERLYAVYLSDKVGCVSVINFFNNFEKYPHVASFETVSRCRRKLQEFNSDLRPPQEVLKARDELQGCFFDWARGVEG